MDPGGITHELKKGMHWLEGKPVFKEGGCQHPSIPAGLRAICHGPTATG